MKAPWNTISRSVGRRYQLLAALLLAIPAYYLLESATDNESQLSSSSRALESAEYDYYMQSMDNMVFNADGSRRYRILAERLTHYPTDDIAILETPRFFIYERGAEQPWQITAESALIDTDPVTEDQRIELIDNVVIHRTDAQGQPVDIYTDTLTVYPDTRLMNTDSPIRLDAPGTRITAVGMTGDLNVSHFRLLNDVQASREQP